MRVVRRFFTLAVLVSYVLLAVGAEPLHLWQVSGCGEACPADSHRASTDRDDSCEHTHHGSQETEHSQSEREQHDSSRCSVCQILGQAQDKVVLTSLTLTGDVVAAVPFALPLLYPEPRSAGFRSRAPPAA